MNPLDVTAFEVLESARTHLNDEQGINWPDVRLLPKLKEAHRELRSELVLVGVPVIENTTTIMTVPAMRVDDQNVDLSSLVGYPADMISPEWMKERQIGQTRIDFVDMQPVDFLPDTIKGPELVWWSWQQETITVLGALNNVEVKLRYKRNIPTPVTVNDTIGFIYGELFLSYRTAALANGSTGNDSKNAFLTEQAKMNLDKVIRMNIKQLQSLPSKRRPYHRGRGRNRVLRAF
jgi:hypothetical protein